MEENSEHRHSPPAEDAIEQRVALKSPSQTARYSRKDEVLTGLGDLCAGCLSGVGAWWIWTGYLDGEFLWWHPTVLVATALVWVFALWQFLSIRGRLRKSVLDDLPSILANVLIGFAVVALGVFLLTFDPSSAGPVFVAASLGAITIPAGRALSYGLLNHYGSRIQLRVLIVGAGTVGVRVAGLLSKNPWLRTQVVGFLDKEPLIEPREGYVESWPLLGSSYDLGDILKTQDINEVIVAFSTAPHHRLLEMIWECDQHGVKISFVPRLFEAITARSAVEDIGGIPLLHVGRVKLKGYNAIVKRALDIFGSLVGLLLLSPLLLLIAVVVKLDSPGPAIFAQRRVGCDGKTFTMYKFRSMRVGSDSAPGWTKRQDPRRTRIGKFLRASSIDELPQLFNVLKGDLSLVGPRPEQPLFVETFTESVYRYTHRHRIKGGLTGWAQINGLRGDTSIEERVIFDNYYIENWSPWLDIKIMIRTVSKAFLSEPERNSDS